MRLILKVFKVILFTYLGCAGSSPLCAGFLQQRVGGGGVICSACASHLRGSSRQSTGARRTGLWALSMRAVVVVHKLVFAVLCCVFAAAQAFLQFQASQCSGFCCGPWAQQLQRPGSIAQAQQLWSTTLVALQHTESSLRRDRTRVLCLGGRILIHCTTKEVKKIFLSIKNVWEIQAIISQF